MRKIITLAVALGCLSFPALASAGSFSTSFNFNNTSPTFDPGPSYPVVPVTISYDPSGVLTITEGGGSDLWNDNVDYSWPSIGVEISGPTGPEGEIDVDDPGFLSVDNIEGSLQGTTTQSGDTLITTYSSPLMAGESWDYVEVDGSASGAPYAVSVPSQYGYFTGSGPAIAVPSHATITDRAATEPDVAIPRPTVSGIAKEAPGYGDPVNVTASGLPPGVTKYCAKTTCDLSGVLRQAGTYTVTITGSLAGATASTSFVWHVLPPHLAVPTGYTENPRYEPHLITIAADGSGFFGGPTGRRLEPRRLKRLGRLRWTSYTATSATATGELWILYGTGALGADRRFEAVGTVRLHLYRVRDGVFTRMTVHEPRSSYRAANGHVYRIPASNGTIKATYSGGSWYW